MINASNKRVECSTIGAAKGAGLPQKLFGLTRRIILLGPLADLRGLLLDHQKLLTALNDDLKACREASRFETSQEDKQRNTVEFSALTTHLMWAESVGDDQPELERVVHSLEANPFLRRYQRWSGRSQKGSQDGGIGE